jgi:hypothetical protein
VSAILDRPLFVGVERSHMTLVVARLSGKTVAIASDTQLTKHERALPIQNGVIKSCLLPGGICVSFSNSPDLAFRDIELFARNHVHGAKYKETVDYFEQSSRKTGNEYILAFANPAKLVKIAGGQRIASLAKTAWIGDKDAYEAFREHEGKMRQRYEAGRAHNVAMFADEPEGCPASDLYGTMRNLVWEPSISSVGGFVYIVSSRQEGFRQSVYCDMLYDWHKSEFDISELDMMDNIILSVSGENYLNSLCQVATRYANLNLVAFYMLSAKKLFLFYGNLYSHADKCTVFSEVSPKEIPQKLEGFLGFNAQWLAHVHSASPSSQTGSAIVHTGSPDEGLQLSFFCHLNTFNDLPDPSTLPPLRLQIPPTV